MVKKHEVVISGISGMYPKCGSIQKLESKIFTQENLITKLEDKVCKIGRLEVIPYEGVLEGSSNAFDHMFFGYYRELAEVISFPTKMSIVNTYKAICDAGICPEELKNSNAAVFMTSMVVETDSILVSDYDKMHGMVGFAGCMQANRISYFLNLHGPSVSISSSWTGAMHLLQAAKSLVESGKADLAIVGGQNKLDMPFFSAHYDSMKHLNPDGQTRSFSADAAGYNRSDGSVVIVLQRADTARRSYGSLVKVDSYASMDKPTHFADPLGFGDFIKDFYSDVNITNNDMAYIECDGCASKNVDAMELNGLSEVFCTKGGKPLLVSSCKSRLGHSEGSSALFSLSQALIALKNNHIPPTLHFTAPNPDVPALLNGNIKVVTEKTPIQGDYVGVTAISMTNEFGHILVKRNPKTAPVKSLDYFPPDDIPRIFLLSGRDLQKMEEILESVLKKPVDENFYALNHKVFRYGIPNHLKRGFTIKGENRRDLCLAEYTEERRPIWYIFTGMGAQWFGMGSGLMKIPVVRRSLERSAKVLATKGVDLMHILTTLDPTIFDDILCSFVGISAIQIALVDLLEELGVVPDGILGHSTGEIGCAYADKCLTAEQTLLIAYYRGKASNEAKLINGMMAAVGLGYNQIKDMLPDDIEVACHNSSTSCTLSGPTALMEKFVAKLKRDGIFAKLVNVSNIAYHTKHVKPAEPYYNLLTKDLIPEPKLRSSKWISSSVPEDQWNTNNGKYCSMKYFINNLLNYVLFEEAAKHVPDNAICIEIAPHGLLQAIIKKSMPDCVHIPLTHRRHAGTAYLIKAIGSLFMEGVDVDVSKIYPPVEFPVPRETEFFDILTWDYTYEISDITIYSGLFNRKYGFDPQCWRPVDLCWKENLYTQGNQFHGVSFFPKSKFLVNILNAEMERPAAKKNNYLSYTFQNIEFCQDLQCNMIDDVLVSCLWQPGTQCFDFSYNAISLVSGRLSGSALPLPSGFEESVFRENQRKLVVLGEKEIYELFEEMGFKLQPPFKNIIDLQIFNNGFTAKVDWKNNFELYLDSVFKLIELYSSIREDSVLLLSTIDQLLVDKQSLPKTDCVIDVYYDETLNYLVAPGIRLFLFNTKPSPDNINVSFEMKKKYFLPYLTVNSTVDFINSSLEILRENCRSVQLVMNHNNPTCKAIANTIDSRDSKIKVITKEEILGKNDVLSYLIVGDCDSFKDVEKFINSRTPFYFIYTGSRADLNGKLLQQLTCVLEQQKDKQTFILYKQKKTSLEDCEFIDMGDANMSAVAVLKLENGPTKSCIHVYTYNSLLEVMATLQLPYYQKSNTRSVFLDKSCAKFNSNSDFYNQQLSKDLKVNVAMKGVWGSVRNSTIALLSQQEIPSSYPLSAIRCKSVDLEVIGINLQSLVYPDQYRKIGVIEYSGVKDGKQVFGLGKLIEGNFLETDPAFCWEKPVHWNMEDAATVPFFYILAYDLLKVRGRNFERLRRSLLIHAGHTPFSQVVIEVAFALGKEVFTTCFSLLQKRFILNKFPQMKPNNIFLIKGNSDDSFADGIMNATNGIGAYITIDNLETTSHRIETARCGAICGFYYLLTNDNMDNNFTIGYRLTEKDVGIYGYNPEMIFDIPEEDKQLLGELMQEGIKSQIVTPLVRHNLRPTLTFSQASDAIVLKNQEDFPVKCIMPVKKLLPSTRQVMNDKSYLIVGGENSLWFDVAKWLVSKGTVSIHILLNQHRIPHNLKIRYNDFVQKHKHKNVSIGDLEKLNSVQSWGELINNMKPTLDSVFYIKKGDENELCNIDKALRAHSKDSCLVTLGDEVSQVLEVRHREGLRSVSFNLASNKLSNLHVINCLNNWLDKCSENDHYIEVEEVKSSGTEQLTTILPMSSDHLVELGQWVSKEPLLTEVVTRCQSDKYARDVDPVIVFPGLQLKETRKLASQLFNPAYMATYPSVIKSLDQLASAFTKILVERFDNSLFTLIAEGWAGPLVLSIAILLEKQGKASSIILLNAAPDNVTQWHKQQNSFLHSHIPFGMQDKMTVDVLRRNITDITRSICKESGDKLNEKAVHAGIENVINKLDIVKDYSTHNQAFSDSIVHLFSPNNILHKSLINMCTYYFRLCLVKPLNKMLEDPNLIESVNMLAVHEFKTISKKQSVKDTSTLNYMNHMILED